MNIIVGSDNPVKINACTEAFRKAFRGHTVDVMGIGVESGVPAQPSNDEMFEGARNRAARAMALTSADYSVGIEGGTLTAGRQLFVTAVICILDSKGREGYGLSGGFLIPPSVAGMLKSMELGDAVDIFSNQHDTKRKGGAVGLFTGGLIDRKGLYEHGITLALAKFLSAGIWN